MTYKIHRHYMNENNAGKIIKTGLTLREAQEWCKDSETSSSTCASLENIEHTRLHGPWFDGYEEE